MEEEKEEEVEIDVEEEERCSSRRGKNAGEEEEKGRINEQIQKRPDETARGEQKRGKTRDRGVQRISMAIARREMRHSWHSLPSSTSNGRRDERGFGIAVARDFFSLCAILCSLAVFSKVILPFFFLF